MDNEEWWDETAEYFQEDYDIPVSVHYGTPVDDSLSLLPDDLDGKRVIELGCGGGQGSVALSKRGASVVGVDQSQSQLDYARELAAEHEVYPIFKKDDIRTLETIDNDMFDYAYSAYALCWVDDINAVFEAASRVLKENGVLVLSTTNPYYHTVDTDTQELERRYSDITKPAMDEQESGTLYFHTIGDIHAALVKNGFTVTELLEPQADNPEEENEYWHVEKEVLEYLPPTIVFRAELN